MHHPEHDFVLDDFQLRAAAALDAGRSVLVAAPTGAGKTVVAEHAVADALATGVKAFYTTPVKALSNQKYQDLVRLHGADAVGLLTGDNSINGTAPVVVMTTEVLRNMIYARAGALEGLRYVVLDEVHFLQDEYRGPVWEEVIVHLPPQVRLVCLSATVSNADELAEWLAAVRGPTDVVVETRRPVELDSLYAVADRVADRVRVVPVLVDGLANPEGRRFDVDPRLAWRDRGRRRHATPRRVDVVDLLVEERLLPAIYFIFSRAACEDAVTACLVAGLRLTTDAERSRIREIARLRTESLGDSDLAVLGYDRWLQALEAGLAAHHAGMVPPFKEAVESCFAEGLVKVVFATETLALGINMPARAVVIEKLTKFTGERHEFLTPAQYTQLTGRAGRRGIDERGSALVLWSPFVAFDQVAELASSRSFKLTSVFRPTYNMAANLVRRYPPDRAHHLLNMSFAQFQADRAVVALERRLRKREQAHAEFVEAARCELGDIEEYRALVDSARSAAARAGTGPGGDVGDALRILKPGDVIRGGGSRSSGVLAVLSVSHRRGGAVRVRALTPARRVVALGAADFTDPPEVVGTVPLPEPFAPKSAAFQKEVASALNRLGAGGAARPERRTRRRRGGREVDHPVAACPDREAHLRAARRAARAGAELTALRRRVESQTGTLAADFDRILQVLETWGHLEGWSLTKRGERLVRIYHECDLLVAECLEEGLLDDLEPPELAALVSCFTYERRAAGAPPEPIFPTSRLRHRFDQVASLAASLGAQEQAMRLPRTRPPDPGFVSMAYAWAAGDDLEYLLEDEDLSGGDFVRNIRQLIDLLRQLGDAAGSPATASSARHAAQSVFRGVVAASSALGEVPVGSAAVAPSGDGGGADEATPGGTSG